jgi:hypothetical protein
MVRFAILLALTLLGAQTAAAVPLLPDLLMEIPVDDVHPGTRNGQPVLFFSSWTVNRGAGPIELRGGPVVNGDQEVYQRIYDSEGSPQDHWAGTFANAGGTVRFNDSADYRLREVNEDDSVGEAVSVQEKVAYCLVDSLPASNPPPGTPASAHYVQCGSVLGISVGWVDNYRYDLPRQWLPLAGVSSGTYWLQNIIDPQGRFIESNENNNETHIKWTVTTAYSPEMDVLGNGISVSDGDAAPNVADHTDFGYANIANGTVVRTFVVQNNGTGTLSVTGVPRVKIFGSSDFTVVAQPTSPVLSGASTSFQIKFDPSGMNSTAEVVIPSNDSDEGPYSFAIRGNANSGNADADNDGMPDDWEALYNLSSPSADEDGDGTSNLDEFVAGNSPRDPNSVFRIRRVERVGATCELTWDSVKGRNYTLHAKGDPGAAGSGELIGTWAGTGAALTVAAPLAGDGSRFFRLTARF